MKKWMRIAIGVIAILACTQIGIFAVQNHRNQKREESETTVQSAGTETQEKDTAEKNTVDSEAAKQEKSNSGIIVKSNVKVITKDTDYEEQPFEISDHSMKFEKDPGYQEGDVIVAGKTARVSDGLIRKVVQVKKATDGYWVETEDASLADVFEKVHVVRHFVYTKKSVSESENLSEEENGQDGEYAFQTSFEETSDPFSYWGETAWNCGLDFQLDVENGEFQYSIAVRSKADLSVNSSSGTCEDSNGETTVFQDDLPDIEFTIEGVPIMITNEMEITAGASGTMEGGRSLSFQAVEESTVGVRYDSRTETAEEIKEGQVTSEGLHWSTTEGTGTLSGYLELHMVPKLCGENSLDLYEGLEGKTDGQAKVSEKEDLGGYAGALDLAITPRLRGTFRDTQELFTEEQQPVWSDRWESSSDWQGDLEWSDTGEQGDIYVTRYGEVNQNPATAFQFEIPRGWEIQTEEVGEPLDEIEEHVVLANDRGVTVSFWSCQHALGGYSRDMLKAQISQADASDFVPGYPWGTDRDCSDLGEFMVARIHITGEMMAGIDADYNPIDNMMFAVIPTSRLGEVEFAGQAGNVDEFSFDYTTPVAFIAEAPDGMFTSQEEKQVIRILKSFKVAESE